MVNDSPTGSKTSPLVKASVRRRDSSLRQLEALHKSSETGSHLRIPDGKRIKLLHDHPSDGVLAASRANKGPKFGTDFSLEDDGVASRSYLMELSDSDEFPEPRELVRASIRNAGKADGSLVACASDYSDSDMDALIRGAHLDGITSTGIDTTNNQDMPGSIQRTFECKGRRKEGHATTRIGATARTETVSPRLGLQVRTHRIATEVLTRINEGTIWHRNASSSLSFGVRH
jgi:hypothetical protein